MNKNQPPRFLLAFFRWFCHPDYVEDIEGDLLERFENTSEQHSITLAKWNFALEVCKLFRPGLVRSIGSTQQLNTYNMFTHYLKIGSRTLWRDRAYSMVNVSGLAIGMAVCLIICQYLYFELSYDSFFKDSDQVYRLVQTVHVNDELKSVQATTASALGVSAKENVPEIESYVRIHPQQKGAVIINSERDRRFKEDKIFFVDQNFLEMFDFSMLHGNGSSALLNQNSIVITKNAAEKYFGNEINPVGKALEMHGVFASDTYTVSGVLEELPANSHLKFDFLIPMSKLINSNYGGKVAWGRTNWTTYIKLKGQPQPEVVRDKINQVIEDNTAERFSAWGLQWQIDLQPLEDIHLKSNFLYDHASGNGSWSEMKTYALIAAFILLIAWLNFINLTTARSLKRAKEVGVRKIMGAKRNQLVSQFVTEWWLINTVSLILALCISVALLPVLGNLLGKNLQFLLFTDWRFWVCLMLVIASGSVVVGFYPAIILASFRPINILKGGISLAFKNRNTSPRKALVVFQFFVSTLLITGTVLVYKQVSYMKSKDLGINMDQVLVIDGPRNVAFDDELVASVQTFKNEVLRHNSVSSIAGSGQVPGKGYNSIVPMSRLQSESTIDNSVGVTSVDEDFLNSYAVDFLAGGDFGSGANTRYREVAINEEASRVLGYELAEDAIDQKLLIGRDTVLVSGVLKNYHWSNLRDALTPMAFASSEVAIGYFSVKVNVQNLQETIDHLNDAFSSSFPGDPFSYFFLDDEFNRQYQSDVQFGNLTLALSVLAVVLASLGLFSLVSYSYSFRTKEVGIRKVLGASLSQLMMLLSKEYFVLLVIAYILAIPVGFYWGLSWLENYAFRVDFGLGIFLVPVIVLACIAVTTVGYRTFRIASINPSDSLRDE